MYIVSYDISGDKLRRKVAKELENFGIRVQYSVFECELENGRYAELYSRLVRLMGDAADEASNDSIRIYDLCQKCKLKTRIIGNEERDRKDDRAEVIVL
jgi:CRISPR-associated protein Cas2